MTALLGYDSVEIGTMLEPRTFAIRRADLVRYAGASGDFNVIHWNEREAVRLGLPNVIAHGMFTMSQVARVLTDWAGDPGSVIAFGVRFTRPVVVPDDDEGTALLVTGVVSEKLPERQVVVKLTAQVDGAGVLIGARATVQLR